jgi:hypothetical protein
MVFERDKAVDNLYNEYGKKCHNYWLSEQKTTPFGFDWQFYKRLAEMAIKEAGRIAIGRQIDVITSQKGFTGIKINADDLERGIQRMEKSRQMLDNICQLKALSMSHDLTIIKPTDINTMYYVLVGCLNNTATATQWKKASKLMKSPNVFNKYKDLLIQKGLVETIKKETITDPEERQRLDCDRGTTIYRAIIKR